MKEVRFDDSIFKNICTNNRQDSTKFQIQQEFKLTRCGSHVSNSGDAFGHFQYQSTIAVYTVYPVREQYEFSFL